MSPHDLSGRTAVLTGASSDLGAAIARALAARGAALVLVGRRAAPLESLAARLDAELRTELGASRARAHVLCTDIDDPSWLARLDACAREVDIVVHAAAAHARYGVLEAVPEAEQRAAFETIYWAAARLCAHVLPGMKRRGFGRIVCIGSAAASLGGLGQGGYAAAKSALGGLMRTLALECGREGVTCNVVEPGLLRTARTDSAVRPDVALAILSSSAAGRVGEPHEVAAAVAFLASSEGGFVTGATLPVGGGLGLGLYAWPATAPSRDPKRQGARDRDAHR